MDGLLGLIEKTRSLGVGRRLTGSRLGTESLGIGNRPGRFIAHKLGGLCLFLCPAPKRLFFFQSLPPRPSKSSPDERFREVCILRFHLLVLGCFFLLARGGGVGVCYCAEGRAPPTVWDKSAASWEAIVHVLWSIVQVQCRSLVADGGMAVGCEGDWVLRIWFWVHVPVDTCQPTVLARDLDLVSKVPD